MEGERQIGPDPSVLRESVGEALGNVTRLAEEMFAYILERVPEAGADEQVRRLTHASCLANAEAALSMVRDGVAVTEAKAPAAALEHARAMANRGHDVDTMLRFYRIGQAYFAAELLPRIVGSIDDADDALAVSLTMQSFVVAYLDRISSHVAEEYVAELDRRQNRVRAERTDAVRALLAGEPVDVARTERVLAHRLTGWQTGLVCWTETADVDLATVGAAVASELGVRHPLLMPDGARSTSIWLSTPSTPDLSDERLAALAPVLPRGVLVAIGRPLDGVAGFRETHAQARRARRVVELSSAPDAITRYDDVALVDVMSQDLDLARRFVALELGPLAQDGERERLDRAALLAFLDAGGRIAAAARALDIHRNTVLNRVRRAESRRGRPATVRTAELHAALRIASVLGPVVLSS